jgi:hypothetical protein
LKADNERTFFWGRKGKKRFDKNKHFPHLKSRMQYTPKATSDGQAGGGFPEFGVRVVVVSAFYVADRALW